jgi:hypothetical protein
MDKKTIQNNLIMIVTLLVICAGIMITVIVIGITENGTEVSEPSGPMTGSLPEHRSLAGAPIIFVPAYEECPPRERVLIDTPIWIVDADGNVAYHWMYECKNTAWNRSYTNPNCTSNT